VHGFVSCELVWGSLNPAEATGHLLHGLALNRTALKRIALKRTARDGYPTKFETRRSNSNDVLGDRARSQRLIRQINWGCSATRPF